MAKTSQQIITDTEARKVETHFLEKAMGGDESVFVYCYHISNETKER